MSSLRPITGLLCSAYAAKNSFVVCFSVVLLLSPTGAQNGQYNNPDAPPQFQNFSPQMAIIIVVLLAALFLMGFLSIYIRHCAENAPGDSLRRMAVNASLRRRRNSRGLDPAVIETFPTLMYSEVKGLKIGKGALECAVCLNEFEDDETLRLIPKCDHVFHPECIDPWLCSHVTCPVCRSDLVPQPGETPKELPDLERNQPDAQNPTTGEISIRVFEDAEEPIPRPPQVIDRSQSMHPNRSPRSGSMRQKLFGKNTERFPRSHSTGHSLVQPGENTEKFTLRLPEDVRKQLMSRAVPGDGSSQRVYRNGGGEDGSNWGLRSFNFRRADRLDQTTARSDRWVFSMAPPFLSRELSMKSLKGEGSTSSLTTPRGTRTAVRLPSFKCLEPKTDEPGLLSEESGEPSV